MGFIDEKRIAIWGWVSRFICSMPVIQFSNHHFSKLFAYKVSHEMVMLQHNLISQ